MKYARLEKFVSQARLAPYLAATGGDKRKADKLYEINIRISKAFYPSLSVLEVTIRNLLDEIISNNFEQTDWILTRTNRISHWHASEVVKIVNKLTAERKSITAPAVVAGTNFSFWASCFRPNEFRNTNGCPLKIFVAKPAQVNRNDVFVRLDSVRKFRNRVYHNEPILFRNQVVDWSALGTTQSDIYELLSWIEPELWNWVRGLGKPETWIQKGQSISP